MRIALFFMFCLVSNVLAQASDTIPRLSVADFNCEELSSHIQTLKESTRTKKEKFSCILNLLKSALTDELDSQCPADDKKETNFINNVLEVKYSDSNQAISETATEPEHGANGAERVMCDKQVTKITQTKTKDDSNKTQNLDVPTMIPIFKPRPVVRNDFNDNFNPTRPIANLRPNPNAPQAVHANSNPLYNAPKFTIPCQRAADVLDMSNMAFPREISEIKTDQANLKSVSKLPSPNLANQTPSLMSVHNADLDETVAILFKPKAISLIQLYGNLLKKITITVLVPYHMSNIGQH